MKQGKLHIITLNCDSGHAFGGCAYVEGNKTREQAIEAIIDSAEGVAGRPLAQIACPVCRKVNGASFADMNTPYDDMVEGRGFIQYVKQEQGRLAKSTNPNVGLFSGRHYGITLLGLSEDGKPIVVKVAEPTIREEIKDAPASSN